MQNRWVMPEEPLSAKHEKLHKRFTKKKRAEWEEEQQRQTASYVQAMAQAEAAAYYASQNGGYTNAY